MSDQDDMIAKQVEAAAARLAEHCDSVVVIVTYARPAEGPEGPRTGIYKGGRGNYYAQRGSTEEWLRLSAADTEVTPTEDDNAGEEWKGGNE